MSEQGAFNQYGDILATGPIQPGKRNTTAIILSLVAVLVVIAGGGAYVGYQKLASKGAQPDEWAPANSVAYLKLDLDPAASEKVSALEFERKFPSAPKVASADELKDSLLDAAFKNSSGKVNYAADIKPWLGDRVALSVYPDASGKAQSIGILQIKDAAKARTSLAKLVADSAPTGGYAIEGDYAVVGPTQAAVDAAVSSARGSSISSSTTYTKDVATLKSDRILTGWADLGAAVKLGEQSDALAGAGMLMPGGFGALGAGATKGRVVVGLRLQPSYAEFEGRLIGGDVSSFRNGNAGSTLAQLPAGALAGVSISGLGDIVKKELATAEQSPLIASGIKSQLDKVGSQLGIALPDDAINLLGNEFAASLDAVPSAGSAAKVTVITEPVDAAKGLETAQKLTALGSTSGYALTASAKGPQIVITNDPSASGTLGDDAGFKAAMGDMPAQVVGAAYVNLGAIMAAIPSRLSNDLGPLKGIGTYEGLDGTDVVFALRLTVG
jgi:hypothetical protein